MFYTQHICSAFDVDENPWRKDCVESQIYFTISGENETKEKENSSRETCFTIFTVFLQIYVFMIRFDCFFYWTLKLCIVANVVKFKLLGSKFDWNIVRWQWWRQRLVSHQALNRQTVIGECYDTLKMH